MNVIDSYYKEIAKGKYYTNEKRLKFYLEEQLFKNIDFKNKTLIDIGGGNGLFSFYAAMKGAKKVVVMEPEFEGSKDGMIKGFHDIKSLLGNPENIVHTNKLLEEYDRENNKFDYILMHNSINHIDEESCIVLKGNAEARAKYSKFFALLGEISEPDSHLIVCDCARRNFLADLGLKNPMAKSIEWEKHQSPQFWASLLSEHGFEVDSISWNSPNVLGKMGKVFFSNFLMSYFTWSHFRLVMRYTKS